LLLTRKRIRDGTVVIVDLDHGTLGYVRYLVTDKPRRYSYLAALKRNVFLAFSRIRAHVRATAAQ
jgi:hypothetical protein